MNEKIINPVHGVYPATEDYVHAIELEGVQRHLLVSGTMGLSSDGVAPDDLEAQLGLIWDNLRTILAAADMTTDNIMRITSYLTDRSQAELNRQARLEALGERRVPTTAIIVQTLDPRWLVEIEVLAMA